MRQHESILSAIALLMTIAWAGCAATIPKTGTLTSPENSVLIDFTLVGSGTVTLQTYGFGRGENAAGTEIPNQCGDVHLQFTDLAAGPSGVAAGSLCNSPALAIVVNVDAGHGISLRGLSGILDCPGRSGNGPLRVAIRHLVPLWEHRRPSPQSNIRLHSDAGCARLSDGTKMETAFAGDQLTYE